MDTKKLDLTEQTKEFVRERLSRNDAYERIAKTMDVPNSMCTRKPRAVGSVWEPMSAHKFQKQKRKDIRLPMIERVFYKEHERIYDVCGVDRKTQQVELLINDICIGVPLNMVTLLLTQNHENIGLKKTKLMLEYK